MPRLSHDAKRLIVQRLATFVSAKEIIAELKEMGIEASYQQILYYDPDAKGTDVAQEWRDLHAEIRARFIDETSSIAISHQSYRLRELDRLYRKVVDGARPNAVLGAQLLKQAAEEKGGAYTNRRELTGKGGEPVVVQTVVTRRIVRPEPPTSSGGTEPSS